MVASSFPSPAVAHERTTAVAVSMLRLGDRLHSLRGDWKPTKPD